jgi:hypothetical protein
MQGEKGKRWAWTQEQKDAQKKRMRAIFDARKRNKENNASGAGVSVADFDNGNGGTRGTGSTDIGTPLDNSKEGKNLTDGQKQKPKETNEQEKPTRTVSDPLIFKRGLAWLEIKIQKGLDKTTLLITSSDRYKKRLRAADVEKSEADFDAEMLQGSLDESLRAWVEKHPGLWFFLMIILNFVTKLYWEDKEKKPNGT